MPEPEPINWSQGWRESIPPIVLNGTRSDTGERSATVPYSEPRCWARPSRVLTRSEHELWLLGQFFQDYYVETGKWLAVEGAIKSESPDFLIPRSDQGLRPLAIELAVFTPQERRRTEPTVKVLRSAIEDAQSDFAHLAGCHVTLTVRPGATLSIVVRQHRDDILQALRASDRPPTLLDQHGLPAGFRTFAQGEGWELSGYELVPRDQLRWHNFDTPLLTVASAIETTLREVARELEATIKGHDYEGVDWLIVPIVAPDRQGLAMFEDEALIQSLLQYRDDDPMDLSTIRCRVMLHFWVRGEIIQLTPERVQVAEPRPEHQRKLTAITYNALGDMFCHPLSFPSLKLASGAS